MPYGILHVLLGLFFYFIFKRNQQDMYSERKKGKTIYGLGKREPPTEEYKELSAQ